MLLTKLLFGNHWHRSTRRGRHLPGPAAVRMGSTPGLVVMRKDFCRNRQPCAWVLSEPCIVRMPFAGFRRREEAEIASSKRKRLLGLRAVREKEPHCDQSQRMPAPKEASILSAPWTGAVLKLSSLVRNCARPLVHGALRIRRFFRGRGRGIRRPY